MARGLHQLTAKEVAATKPGGILNDGGGLFLKTSANGDSRKWVLRFKLPGQNQREMGLGTFGAGGVSLALARQKAAAAREKIALGIDPISDAQRRLAEEQARRAAETNAATFGDYATRVFLPYRTARLTNAKHRWQWVRGFELHAAVLWPRKLNTITREDVLAVLRPIWDKHHVTAQRIRGRLENLFDHAIQNGAYHGDNPARWSLFNATLSTPRKMEGKGHQPAMPRAAMPGFIQTLRKAQETSVGALALEFAILTASRSGEVRLARWAEIDMSAKLWRVPASRMKMRRPHAVPLTSRMVEILEAARGLHLTPLAPDSLIFPGAKAGKPLSDMTLLSALKRATKLRATVHGFRSTFRDWAGNQTEHPRELIEEALAHALPAVEAAYRREQAVERRRVVMQDWQDFLDGAAPTAKGGAPAPDGSGQEASPADEGNVVQFRAAGG